MAQSRPSRSRAPLVPGDSGGTLGHLPAYRSRLRALVDAAGRGEDKHLFGDAFRALTASVSSPQHEFWPHDTSLTSIDTEMRSRIAGHHQLADAMLLDLAIRRSGRLATFDRLIANLLAAGSPNQGAIELIPV